MHVLQMLPRFRRATRTMKILAQRESWSRAQIDAFQLDQLNQLWARSTERVPYYMKLAQERKLPKRFGSIAEFALTVPILPKQHVRERAAELRAPANSNGRTVCMYTSGSTGVPMAGYWSVDSHRETLATKYRSYAAFGVGILDRSVFLWGHGASEEKGLRGWLSRVSKPYHDLLRNRLRLSACDLSKPSLQNYLRQIEAFQPVMIYGYARALYLLAQEAEHSGFECESLKLVVATSEPAWPSMIERMERAFGADVAREYGSVECGIIATDWPMDRALHVREDHVLLETLPRPDGQYDIVVTVLNNPSFPLIRYAIGDLTAEPLRRGAQGFAVLGAGVAGRQNDLLVTRSGANLHWIHVEYAIADAVQDLVRRFSVRQASDGSVEVDVELDDSSKQASAQPQLTALREDLQNRLEGYPVQVRVVDRVRQTTAGKHVVVRSELCNPTLGGRLAGATSQVSSVLSALGAIPLCSSLI